MCCNDVNIFLSPYDVLRLKNALGINSQVFISRYTVSPFHKDQSIPVIALKMNEDTRNCPFVSDTGCQVYQDRPWACRMYPLNEDEAGTFLVSDSYCNGHKESDKWSFDEWRKNQQLLNYDENNAAFRKLLSNSKLQQIIVRDPRKLDMLFMVFYNIDKFRLFIFKSSFLDRFIIDQKTIEAIREDDAQLLNFGIKWLNFSFFGEPFFEINKGYNS